MGDLELKGTLDLRGMLDLSGASGGKVKAGGQEALVVQAKGTAPPFIFPPAPASPIDVGTDVTILVSLNQSVKAGGKVIVTQGMVLQGNLPTWPGFVMRGSGTVTINAIPINVVNERATIFPSGGSATFSQSNQ